MSDNKQTPVIIDPAKSRWIGAYMDDLMKHVALIFRDAISAARAKYPETKSDYALLASAIIYACDIELGEDGPKAIALTRTLQHIQREANNAS